MRLYAKVVATTRQRPMITWASTLVVGAALRNVVQVYNERGQLSQPHFGLSVRVKPTLPKVGTWSPSGLPKT
jgi:hypothetical protein